MNHPTTITVYRPTLGGFIITIAGTAVGYAAGKVLWALIRRERKKEIDELKRYIDFKFEGVK